MYIIKTALQEDTIVHKHVVNLLHVSAVSANYICDITGHYFIFLY